MKKIGFVIDSNENSAKIKLNDSKKIIIVNNNIDAKIGQEVCIELKKITAIKLIYIYYTAYNTCHNRHTNWRLYINKS